MQTWRGVASLVLLCGGVLVGLLVYQQLSQELGGPTMTIAGTRLALEIASTPQQREQGLSGQDSLPPNHGMLFLFDQDGYHGIWMKDMRFPIDIMWLDQKGVVVGLEANVLPRTYPKVFNPQLPARFVLELPAGFTQTHKVHLGAPLSLPTAL